MSLRLRLLASIGVSLVLALLLGGAVLLWHARISVHAEVGAAFQGAVDGARDTLKGDVEHTVTARQIIASFNGQRHIRASLIAETGRAVIASRPAPAEPVPGWFAALVAPPPLEARIAIPIARFPCVLLLQSDPDNEAGEVWDYARDAFITLALFCAGVLLLSFLTIHRALRFFPQMRGGLQTVADGDYEARLAEAGPPEFAALAAGFNHMAGQLGSYRQRNQRLQLQILGLQEEERAQIARDLHDEVGPYLFAIQVDADAVAKSGGADTRERAGSIREAAQHVQQQVKQILRQLRPVNGLEFGLDSAIADLCVFWQRRHPAIRFVHDIAPGLALDRRGEETAFRIVQESVSNAVRHGRPALVRIALAQDEDDVLIRVEDDGLGLDDADAAGRGGMGLAGMAERVRGLNGHFAVENAAGRGVTVRASLPRQDTRQDAQEMQPA